LTGPTEGGPREPLEVRTGKIRDHYLPPDRDAFVHSDSPKGRIIVIAPTRAACETIERALGLDIDTLLRRKHGEEVVDLAKSGEGFGIVAGTGTGKTLAVRPIALAVLESDLKVGVVNREREATPETPSWNVVIVTTGIARRWFQDELITSRDTLVVDEIHQTSAELELCLALGKRVGCRFIWLSATVDPKFFAVYLNAKKVLHSTAFDSALAAKVLTHRQTPVGFFQSQFIKRVIDEKRGVAVFLPTRAEVEQLAAEVGDRWAGLKTAFYHGGEPIRVIRPFLDGEAKKPFLLAMTAAGQSALNIPGLDTVVINDGRFAIVVDRGRSVLTRKPLGANEILQMAGRVHGRVEGGEVHILTERDLHFKALVPQPPEFQLSGDSERVALTAAAIGIDLEELELPVPLDRRAYRRAVHLLTERGIVENGRLTEYGRAVEAMPVDRPWAEMLVHCDADLLPFVAVASNVGSLHRMTRDEPDLSGLVISGSDHLTAYNVFAEAVNAHGSIGRVYGLERHQFAEGLEDWATNRGVLMKAIEDTALGIASVFRTLGQPLPEKFPRATNGTLKKFAELLVDVMPFDLVIDQEQSNGRKTRVSRGSVCNKWGPVTGEIRYFALRDGSTRAAIEGTNLPLKLLSDHAVPAEAIVEFLPKGKRSNLTITRLTRFHGFEMDFQRETLPEPFPKELERAAREGLADSVLAGATPHHDQVEISRALLKISEYSKKSKAILSAAHPDVLRRRLAEQLSEVTSFAQFLETPVSLTIADVVPKKTRQELDSLPAFAHIGKTKMRLEYEVDEGEPVVVVVLKSNVIANLSPKDLPVLDRPMRFVTFLGSKKPIRAKSLNQLKQLLRQEEERRHGKGRHGRGGGGGPGRGGRGRRRH
jgi:ATP-dependent helicase HrpA